MGRGNIYENPLERTSGSHGGMPVNFQASSSASCVTNFTPPLWASEPALAQRRSRLCQNSITLRIISSVTLYIISTYRHGCITQKVAERLTKPIPQQAFRLAPRPATSGEINRVVGDYREKPRGLLRYKDFTKFGRGSNKSTQERHCIATLDLRATTPIPAQQ